jgi:hypothetical protein
MPLTVNDEELQLLRRILPGYLSELREEVGKTEAFKMRQALKDEEALLKQLIERIEGQQPTQPQPSSATG